MEFSNRSKARSVPCSHLSHECGLRQFAHELALVDHLRQSPYVTSDPREADLFLVPFPSTLFFMYARSLSTRSCERCEAIESALLAFFAERERQRWERCGGQDHVFFSLRCPTAWGQPMSNRGYTRGLFNLVNAPLRGIHLCLEPPPLESRGRMGKPSGSEDFHRLVVPSFVDMAPFVRPDYEQRTSPKSSLLFFQGGPLNAVRQLVSAAMGRAADCRLLGQSSRFALNNPTAHADAIAHSTFCLCPRGDTAIAKRQYDSVASRCIPVAASDGIEWAFARRTLPSTFTLQVREADIARAPNVSGGKLLLAAVRSQPAERIAALQSRLSAVWRRYRYGEHWEPGDVLDSVVEELADRVRVLREAGCGRARDESTAEQRPEAHLRIGSTEWSMQLQARFDELFPRAPRVPYEDISGRRVG